MSTLAPARPTTSRAAAADSAVAAHPRTGSYVDTDRYQAPAGHVGSYVTGVR